MANVTRDRKLLRSRSARMALVATLGLLVLASLLGPWLRPRSSGGAALATARALLSAKLQAGQAAELEAACKDSDSCSCVEQVALKLLDREQAELAGRVLGEAAACAGDATSLGLQAEALARQGQAARALVVAANALERSDQQRSALYAKALALYRSGNDAEALAAAERAVVAGRGEPAYQLLGALQARRQAWQAARGAYEHALELDADDITTRYNLALVAQRQNDYRRAREGYLALLKRAPDHADARYNLGVLTHNEGVSGEARHHLRQLAKIVAPEDTRLKKLSALLDAAEARAQRSAGSPDAPVAQY